MATTTRFMRAPADTEQRATFLELSFDLVFVLAITQLSHRLLLQLTAAGAAQTLVLEQEQAMVKSPEHPMITSTRPFAALIEIGEVKAEAFDVAETDVIEHTEHGDQPGTDPIWPDAASFDEQEAPGVDEGR
jgi:Bacterial low temperature requirement A protein (LtrA)